MTEFAEGAITVLRSKRVRACIGLSPSTLYLRIAEGTFAKPVSLGCRAVGWSASEVAALNDARIAGQIRRRSMGPRVKARSRSINRQVRDGQTHPTSVGLRSTAHIQWKRSPV